MAGSEGLSNGTEVIRILSERSLDGTMYPVMLGINPIRLRARLPPSTVVDGDVGGADNV